MSVSSPTPDDASTDTVPRLDPSAVAAARDALVEGSPADLGKQDWRPIMAGLLVQFENLAARYALAVAESVSEQ